MVNLTVPIVLIILGGILVLLAFIGGGIKIQKLEFPKLPKKIQIASGIIGSILIIMGIVIFYMPPKQDKTKKLPSPPPPQVDIKGEVREIFDNPRKDVVVIVRGTQRCDITDKEGQYHLSNIPFQNNITLEAYYGKERGKIKEDLNERYIGGVAAISEHLILEHPDIRVEAKLCREVVRESGHFTPIDIFEKKEEEALHIPSDMEEVWCFAKVFGPLNYEKDKEITLSFKWYCNGDLKHEYNQPGIGFSPFGWKTFAWKTIWLGSWELRIEAKHKKLAHIYFEVDTSHSAVKGVPPEEAQPVPFQ